MKMDEFAKVLEAYNRSPHFYDLHGKSSASILYQYRSFQTFLTILKSDSFWATNARFSNDEAEQRFATEILEKPLHMQDIHIRPEKLNENYIVCFSKERDKLSQWRGYAPDGGVSIGYDFSGPSQFYVAPTGVTPPLTTCTRGQSLFVQAEPVVYLPPRRTGQSEDEYFSDCYQTICFDTGSGPLEDSDIKKFEDEISKKAPYIKHAGFQEEDEWRLVFPNDDGKLNQCIRYKEDSSIIKTPYIVVCPGDPTRNSHPCVIRVCIWDKGKAEKLIKEVHTKLSSLRIESCLPVGTTSDLYDEFCSGCTRRRWMDCDDVTEYCRYHHSGKGAEYYLGLPEQINNVIISQGEQQQKVFDTVHQCVQEIINNSTSSDGSKVKVWCEGHLPVRSITVGPSSNQGNIVEFVEHYCRHTYWLRDVDIYISNIPYRKSLI